MSYLSNTPELWIDQLRASRQGTHKYERGMAVVYGAPEMTGATWLAASACARMGAGVVRVVAPKKRGDLYRAILPAHIIVDEADSDSIFDPRCRAVLMGPGTGPKDLMGQDALPAIIKAGHINGVVLDAGAFLYWAGKPLERFAAFSRPDKVLLTPHEGEFSKLFGGRDLLAVEDRAEKLRAGAAVANASILLKGPVTLISCKEETIAHDRPLPELATAGTGDVLAGMVTGLLCNGMPLGLAAAASVWIHAEAASRIGAGLVASDLPEVIPYVLKDLGL